MRVAMVGKILPCKSKDYREGKLETTNIQNFQRVFKWINEAWNEDFESGMSLLADNREVFRYLFGKPCFYFRGEFYHHGWLFEFKGRQIVVLTAKGKGTSYELVNNPKPEGPVPDKEDTIIEFLDLLRKELQDARVAH
jgi:hypothetical protein